ncbi:MAG: polyprenyl synthetase family protein [Paludibacteraceae bacterium]|nr:polyprenyl synthetase family protein [Paludibacteraceae bacterium]
MERYLQIIEEAIRSNAWKREPNGLYEPIEYVLSLGGKRIRPCLTLMACNLFSNDLTDAVTAGLALEVFHNFTLLHDDVMDKADTRRGYPTVHKRWNENTAILSGDAMLVEAYRILSGIKSPKFTEVLDLFTKTADEVCKGQQYDMEFETRDDVSLDEYMEMIRLKTAVLLAASLKIGAILGGATDSQAQLLYDFGIYVGLGFQLRDDYLDSFGDPVIFGKKIGGDILCGKKTFLLLTAKELAHDKTLDTLNNLLSLEDKKDNQKKIDGIIEIYKVLGVNNRCEEACLTLNNKAVQCIKKLQLPDNKSILFTDFANKMVNRKK